MTLADKKDVKLLRSHDQRSSVKHWFTLCHQQRHKLWCLRSYGSLGVNSEIDTSTPATTHELSLFQE